MGIITEIGMAEISAYIADYFQSVEITVDDAQVSLPIYKRIATKDGIKIYIMLDDTIVGNISRVVIYGIKSTVVVAKEEDIIKDSSKGLLVSIPISIVENYKGSESR